MKKLLLGLIAFCLVSSVFTADLKSSEDLFLYSDAKESFDGKDYGRALKLCEDAVFIRKHNMTKEIQYLKTAVEPQEVVKAGDKISDVISVLESRDEYEAVELFNFYLKRKGEDFFQNSLKNFFEYLESIVVFPEVQKLIGDIYKLEGEYQFAEMYYKEALKNAAVLDIPDERYDILYDLADISRLQNDKAQEEARLLAILSEDSVYSNKALTKSLERCIFQNKKDSVEKLFTMYRAENFYMMKAYSHLSEYYREMGEKEKSLIFVSLEVLTGYTKAVEVINKRNINFENKGLASVLFEVSLNQDIVQWGIDNELWKGFYNLAVIARENDCYLFADTLLKILAEYCPEEYYRKASVLLIK